MIGIDTNILIYAHRSATLQHKAAREAIEKASSDTQGWGICLPSLAEFWSVVTHPRASKRPSTGAEASAFLQTLIADTRAQIWLPSSGFDRVLLEVASDLNVTGPRVFDLMIALMAIENGADQIWTHDRAFTAVPGLKVRHLSLS